MQVILLKVKFNFLISSNIWLIHVIYPLQHLEEKGKSRGKRLLGGVERGSRGVKQPVEIIGVEDITQQIAVQMEGRGEQGEREGGRGVRDTVIEVGHPSC